MRVTQLALVLVLSIGVGSFACAGTEAGGDGPDDDGDASGSGGQGTGGSDGGSGGGCEAVDETCDGVDNDCDGEVDEPPCACAAGATQACYSGPAQTRGLGACTAGTQTCDGMGVFGACTGEVTPGDETCNAEDDDCNGMVDDLPDISCGVGACAAVVAACAGGQDQECVPGVPGLETCDGVDNDCDQLTDESDPLLGTACDSGLLGACAAGTYTCEAGGLTCTPNLTPVPEKCDLVDEDCNGTVDDNVVGTGGACNSGFSGPCASGTILCQAGNLDCVPDVPPAAEVCNGVDDDCNGTIDNQAPCPSPLTCSNGVCDLVCVNGTTECNNVCVDTDTSQQHCGACNSPCPLGFDCENGTCEPPCGGWLYNNACWYTASSLGMTCNQVCAPHGGFDVAGSQHTGNAVGFHFWPQKAFGSDWETVECSSTDNNTNWGANGQVPNGNFSHPACYVNCACLD